jgi:hypothetical protein
VWAYSDDQQLPTANVLGIDYGAIPATVVVRCPFCRRVHTHGLPVQDLDLGLRSAECGRGSYIMRVVELRG